MQALRCRQSWTLGVALLAAAAVQGQPQRQTFAPHVLTAEDEGALLRIEPGAAR